MTVLRTLRTDTSPANVHESPSPGRHRSWIKVRRHPLPTRAYARLTFRMASCAILLILGLGLGTGAGAHAILVGSEPAHGAILDESPRRVLFRFNAALEHAVTRVYLVNVDEVRTPLRTIDSSVDWLVVDLPRLSPGVYTIVYKVLARDGHVTDGSIRFTIRAR